MSIRPDAEFLRTFVRGNQQTRDITTKICTWPILDIPLPGVSAKWDAFFAPYRERDTLEVFDELNPTAEMPFSCFGFTVPSKSLKHKQFYVYVDSVGDASTDAIIYLSINDHTMATIYSRVKGKIIRVSSIGGKYNHDAKFINNNKAIIMDMYIAAITMLMVFMKYVKESDDYPVEVREVNARPLLEPTSKAAAMKDRAKGATLKHVIAGPKIIYLDKLPVVTVRPATSNPVGGGQGKSKKGHHRIGHWKTLTHPKYANHPKYLVFKGVYVKAAWVGPTETVYEGNIYKLHRTN